MIYIYFISFIGFAFEDALGSWTSNQPALICALLVPKCMLLPFLMYLLLYSLGRTVAAVTPNFFINLNHEKLYKMANICIIITTIITMIANFLQENNGCESKVAFSVLISFAGVYKEQNPFPKSNNIAYRKTVSIIGMGCGAFLAFTELLAYIRRKQAPNYQAKKTKLPRLRRITPLNVNNLYKLNTERKHNKDSPSNHLTDFDSKKSDIMNMKELHIDTKKRLPERSKKYELDNRPTNLANTAQSSNSRNVDRYDIFTVSDTFYRQHSTDDKKLETGLKPRHIAYEILTCIFIKGICFDFEVGLMSKRASPIKN